MEWLDIVDENGHPTGETVERSYAHRHGIRHRTAHVWIFRRQNGHTEILLQKRSDIKDSFPGEKNANHDIIESLSKLNFPKRKKKSFL